MTGDALNTWNLVEVFLRALTPGLIVRVNKECLIMPFLHESFSEIKVYAGVFHSLPASAISIEHSFGMLYGFCMALACNWTCWVSWIWNNNKKPFGFLSSESPAIHGQPAFTQRGRVIQPERKALSSFVQFGVILSVSKFQLQVAGTPARIKFRGLHSIVVSGKRGLAVGRRLICGGVAKDLMLLSWCQSQVDVLYF